MAGYLGYSNTDWARDAATTLANHIREEEQAWMRSFAIGAMIEAGGNIMYNQEGRGFDWPVRYRRHNLEGNSGETERNFVQRNLWQTAFLEYRGYQAVDSITEKSLQQNRGDSAIIKLWDNFQSRLDESVQQGLAGEFFVDGSATGNSLRWHGFESFFGGTQTITEGTAGAVARTANAGDVSLYPSDTYAGLSTILGNYGGSWGTQTAISSTWPAGRGELQYDFYSPIVVNYTSTAFSGSADTWAEQCVESTRFLIVHMSRYESDMGDMQVVLLDRELYRQYLQKLDSKERINTSSALGLRSLGFQNTFQQDGVDITWEFGMPSAVGYGYNIKHMQLRSCQDRLFKTEGPTWEPLQRMFWVIIDFYGQLKFHSPRFFGKLATIA